MLLGNGDGTFATNMDYVAGLGPCSVAVVDFNSDGKPDLAGGNNTSNTVSVLLEVASRRQCPGGTDGPRSTSASGKDRADRTPDQTIRQVGAQPPVSPHGPW